MRSEKIAIERELQEQVGKARSLFIVEYKGMKVAQLNELRRLLSNDHARFRVFKNTFLRRAAADRQWPAEFGDNLKGMIAVVIADDPVVAARLLYRFSTANKMPLLRGGILEDRPLSAAQVTELANLPSREQLLGQLVGTLASPLSGLVGVLNAAQSQLVRVLKAVETKKSAA